MYVCMSQVPKHVCMYVCLEPREVPPLTNLKKLNYRSNTERFFVSNRTHPLDHNLGSQTQEARVPRLKYKCSSCACVCLFFVFADIICYTASASLWFSVAGWLGRCLGGWLDDKVAGLLADWLGCWPRCLADWSAR